MNSKVLRLNSPLNVRTCSCLTYGIYIGYTSAELPNHQQYPLSSWKVSSSLWSAVCLGSTGASPPLWQTGGHRAHPHWPPGLPPAWRPFWPQVSLCYRSHPHRSERWSGNCNTVVTSVGKFTLKQIYDTVINQVRVVLKTTEILPRRFRPSILPCPPTDWEPSSLLLGLAAHRKAGLLSVTQVWVLQKILLSYLSLFKVRIVMKLTKLGFLPLCLNAACALMLCWICPDLCRCVSSWPMTATAVRWSPATTGREMLSSVTQNGAFAWNGWKEKHLPAILLRCG